MSSSRGMYVLATLVLAATACAARDEQPKPSGDLPKYEGDGFVFIHETKNVRYKQPGGYEITVVIDLDGGVMPTGPKSRYIGGHPTYFFENEPSPSTPQVLRAQAPSTEKVYEYRSGRLIPGVLDRKDKARPDIFDSYAVFVPDLDGKIIRITDYTPKSGVRIYNLPGHFEAKKK